MMRCPLRVKAFDKPDECDPACALLVHVTHWDDYELRTVDDGLMCAITATAVQGGFTVEPLNTGAKKANNGIEPGIRVKGVSGIPLTPDEWAQVADLEEKFDSTQGFLFREAMRAYLREKTWLRKGMVKR